MDSINRIIEEIRIEAKDKGLDSLSKNLDKLLKKFNEIDTKVKKFNDNAKKAASNTKEVGNKFEQFMNKLSKSFIHFNGNMLSILFFGMEMKRIFSGALKSIFEGYKKIIPEQSEFNLLTTKLAANWEFFKFQLADALANSDIFKILIEYAINLIRWFQQLSPETKKNIVLFFSIGAAVGFVLEKIGMMFLGLSSLYNIFKILIVSGKDFVKKLVDISKKINNLKVGPFKKLRDRLKDIINLKVGPFFKKLIASLTNLIAHNKKLILGWLGFLLVLGLVSAAWKKLVDTQLESVGLMVDDWYDYVTIFVVSFSRGLALIVGGVISVGKRIIDIFVTIGEAIGDIIWAAFDPDTTVEDVYKRYKKRFSELFSLRNILDNSIYRYIDTTTANMMTKVVEKITVKIPNTVVSTAPTDVLKNVPLYNNKYSDYITRAPQQNINNNIVVVNKDELYEYLPADQVNLLQEILNNVQSSGY